MQGERRFAVSLPPCENKLRREKEGEEKNGFHFSPHKEERCSTFFFHAGELGRRGERVSPPQYFVLEGGGPGREHSRLKGIEGEQSPGRGEKGWEKESLRSLLKKKGDGDLWHMPNLLTSWRGGGGEMTEKERNGTK